MHDYFSRVLKTQTEYVIPLTGLKEGIHEYVFDIEKSFFELYEGSEISDGQIRIDVGLEKGQGILTLNLRIMGWVQIPCDRCLDEYTQNVDFEGTVYVKFDDKQEYDDADIVVLPHSSSEIDMTQIFFDYINLSLPFQKIHPLDNKGKSSCNKEMISKLKKHSISREDEIDPRWDNLKDLLKNN